MDHGTSDTQLRFRGLSQIQAKCLTIVHRAITHFIRKKSKQKDFKARLHPGAVTLIQRFGGSLNLNVHYHMLFLEGGYYQTESSLEQGPKFWWVDAPTDAEIQAMVSTLAIRVIRCLKRNGYLRDDVDGTSHLLFSGLEFVETLRTGVRKAGSPVDCPVAGCGGKENAALVPPPRIHLTRFFGCLAPHAKLRSLIVPKKVEPQTPATVTSVEARDDPKRSKRKSWAELLARVFDIDVKKCSYCAGELKIIAAIIEVGAIRKILGHLGLPDKPPDIAPARLPTQLSFA